MKERFFEMIRQSKNYARFTGGVLFLIGLLGFAFRQSSVLPDTYLLAFLVLGFWGVIVGVWDNR